MVHELSKLGKLRNCIAVCDVSLSMTGIPMNVCVPIGNLISELGDEPWKRRVFSFSGKPRLHKILGKTLDEKKMLNRRIDWGKSTNLGKVFIFSYLDFDDALEDNRLDDQYDDVCQKFMKAGSDGLVPEIVFWNVQCSDGVSLPLRQKGVVFLNGYSKHTLKMFFIHSVGVVTPVSVMVVSD
ncbi:hypothetical protein DsansV1_C01g0001771 [Dioscorea sansibarensis]